MLQQTRVETVRERWPLFLARFPDVRTLARAREQSVLKAWEGLGYYRRARALREAAAAIAARHGGRVPARYEDLLALPGFGRYTAAAVASIAHGRPHAVVDGNVERVVARLLALEDDPRTAGAKRRRQDVADRLLARTRPGDWNQAVMELGATVCTPRRPTCAACPLMAVCRAHAAGEPEGFPLRSSRKRIPHHDIAAAFVWRGERVLIARRPAEGLLGGLWEFPGGKREGTESLQAAAVREVREETGLEVRIVAPGPVVKHAYSHFKITLHLFHAVVERGRARSLGSEEVRWVGLGEIDRFAFPRANRRVLDVLLAEGRPGVVASAERPPLHSARIHRGRQDGRGSND